MSHAFSWQRSVGAIVICFCFLNLGLRSSGLAQSKDEPKQPLFPVFSVLITKVKPEMLAEWEGLQSEVNAALKKGGVTRREVWQTAAFGDVSQFMSITPLKKFAELDGPTPLEGALGKNGSNDLFRRINQCVLEYHRYAQRVRFDLGLHKRMPERATMAIITVIHVAPGRGSDFETFIKKDLLPTIQKSQIENYWLYDTVLGGDPNTWFTVSPVKNWAEFDSGPPIVRTLGSKGLTEFLVKAPGTVTSLEQSVYRYREDLSYSSENSPKASATP